MPVSTFEYFKLSTFQSRNDTIARIVIAGSSPMILLVNIVKQLEIELCFRSGDNQRERAGEKCGGEGLSLRIRCIRGDVTQNRLNRVIVARIGNDRTRAAQAAAETRSRFNKHKHKITRNRERPCPCSAYMRFVKRNFRWPVAPVIPARNRPPHIQTTDCRFPR